MLCEIFLNLLVIFGHKKVSWALLALKLSITAHLLYSARFFWFDLILGKVFSSIILKVSSIGAFASSTLGLLDLLFLELG